MNISKKVVTVLCLAWAFCASAAEYPHQNFGFIAQTPEDWHLYGKLQNKDRMILDFGLPKVWSEIEQQDIENSVYIRAYRGPSVKSLMDVIKVENERTSGIVLSREPIQSELGKAFVVISKIRGLEYKSQVTYYYANGVGYEIGFTATHGTYDKNLTKYKRFVEAIKFIAPAAPEES